MRRSGGVEAVIEQLYGCGHLVWPRLRSSSSRMLAPPWGVRLLLGGLACRHECWPLRSRAFSGQ